MADGPQTDEQAGRGDAVSEREMAVRRDLSEHVDTGLRREAQETAMGFFSSDGWFDIETFHPTLTRKLLRHGEARIRYLHVRGVNERGRREGNIMADGLVDRVREIDGIRAWMPIGTLTIKGSVRKSNRISNVINTPERVEMAREAFDR